MLDATKIYKKLQGQLHELDQERELRYKKVEPFKWSFWLIFIAGGAFVITYANTNGDEATLTFIIAYGVLFFISLILFLGLYFSNLKKFKEEFINNVAPKIIKCLGVSFTYSYNGQIPLHIIRESKLFSSFNKYDCQDLVTGVMDKNMITFAEIKLIKRTQSSNNNNSSTTIFSGLFFQAELTFNFPTGIWIVPRHHWKSFWGDDRERIKIDHPSMKPYRIYANNKEVAEQVLQPYILDRIEQVNSYLKKSKISKRPVNYHFENNKVQAALSTQYKFMEPKLGESIDSESFIRKQTDLLNAMSSLLKNLTLS